MFLTYQQDPINFQINKLPILSYIHEFPNLFITFY